MPWVDDSGAPVTDPMLLKQLGPQSAAPATSGQWIDENGKPVTDSGTLAQLNFKPGASLEKLPYIGPAAAALNAATAKSQDWFAPTKFLNSISSPLLDWSGVPNQQIAAAQSAAADKNHPVAATVGDIGGAFMNMPQASYGAIPASKAALPIARVAAATAGGALGGASQGNTPSERAQNALYGGGAAGALGLVGEGARAALPLAKTGLHALQGVALPAYLLAEHYGDALKEYLSGHLPWIAPAAASLFAAPYVAPKIGEMVAPNAGGQR